MKLSYLHYIPVPQSVVPTFFFSAAQEVVAVGVLAGSTLVTVGTPAGDYFHPLYLQGGGAVSDFRYLRTGDESAVFHVSASQDSVLTLAVLAATEVPPALTFSKPLETVDFVGQATQKRGSTYVFSWVLLSNVGTLHAIGYFMLDLPHDGNTQLTSVADFSTKLSNQFAGKTIPQLRAMGYTITDNDPLA